MDDKERLPLTLFERFFYERNKGKYASNFFVAAVYTSLDATLLSNALRELILVYPELSYNVFGHGIAAGLKTVSKIKFDDVVKFISVPELESTSIKLNESISQDIINHFFEMNADKPLWSLCVVNNETIIFYCDHLLFDGGAGANFHHVLLQQLNQFHGLELTKQDVLFDASVDQVEKKHAVINDEVYEPSLMLKLSCLYEWKAPKIVQDTVKYIKSWLIPEEFKLSGKKFAGRTVFKTNYFLVNTEYIKVTNEILQKLIKVCKEHKVALTSLMVYLSLTSLAQVTGDDDVSVEVPIGLRGRLKTSEHSDETFGLFVKEGSLSLPTIPDLPKIDWYCVEYVHRAIISAVNSNTTLELTGLLKYYKLDELLAERINKPLGATLEVSNLAQQKPDNTGVIKIVDMYFNQGLSAYINLSVVSTPIGGMNIGCSYNPGDASDLQRTVERLSKKLNDISQLV